MVSQSKTARPLGETEGAATNSVAPAFSPPVVLSVPCPPSMNNAFYNRRESGGKSKGRGLKRHVADWLAYALREIDMQFTSETITEPVLIVVNIERHSLSADIDNRMKLLFDALVKGGVLLDDKQITGFAAAWAEPHTKRARVAIFPVHKLDINFHPSAKKNGACGGWFYDAPLSPEEEEAE